MTADKIIEQMLALGDEYQKQNLMRFFKTGEGEYGYGDEFIGLKVPVTRQFVKAHKDLQREEIQKLIDSKYHEVRLCGFLILVEQFDKLCKPKYDNDIKVIAERDEIIRFYLENSTKANNWDLVDMSAPKLVGKWMMLKSMLSDDEKLEITDKLSESENLWQQRISIVFTWTTSHYGKPEFAFRYAQKLISHKHDLIQKAVGWMLREAGKHNGLDVLREFLEDHHAEMSRTSLRYAIEHMEEKERKYWLLK